MATELDKATQELEQINAEQDGAAEDPMKKSRANAIAILSETLSKSAAEELADRILKSDDGHDPEQQKREIAGKVKSAKKRNPDNESDNQSLSEQESEQEETVEEAEGSMQGSVLVSGNGKKNADFRGKTPGRDVGAEVRAAQTDKSRGSKGNGLFDRENFFRSLAESDEFTEVLEASPALAHLTDVVADRLEAMDARSEAHFNRISKSLAALMTAQAGFMKSFASSDAGARTPASGVIGRLDGRDPQTLNPHSNGALRRSFTGNEEGPGNQGQLKKSEIAGALKKAVDDGAAHPDELARFDVGGIDSLAMDDATRTKYGVPLSIKH